MTMPSGSESVPLADRASRFLSSWFVGVVARVDAGDNRVFPCCHANAAGERHVGGSGEPSRASVERMNDKDVIPQ